VDHRQDAAVGEAEDVQARVDLAGGADDVRVAAPRVGADAAALHDEAAVVGDAALGAGVQGEPGLRGGVANRGGDGPRHPVHHPRRPLLVGGAGVEAGVDGLGVGGEVAGAGQHAAGVRVGAVDPDV